MTDDTIVVADDAMHASLSITDEHRWLVELIVCVISYKSHFNNIGL